ncbi:putative ArsR family transcriptional regulator [Kribbella steppae]|uniref:Putative ArsR family transcriptional regulator n=1 Tax=Kribbella steppae TaxID=2512223 RepID=A0A4R2H301_9ACTN|nr:putative ArsR family transcriptional regulator [Kribbella steppae]
MGVSFRLRGVDDTRDARILAVATLEEPTRRRLYDHVVRQTAAVTRDEAATALGLPRATAAFHLDRLADEGLLDVVFERRTGRSGPGAGRPSKLYRRSDWHVEVSLPEHRYDLAGRLLAAAIEDAEDSGESPREALDRRARQLGNELAAAARTGAENSPEVVMRVLEAHGFEPRADEDAILLGNCPFHTLAQQHTDLVCAMNLCLLDGVLAGLDATQLQANLKPEPGQCCVRIEPVGTSA